MIEIERQREALRMVIGERSPILDCLQRAAILLGEARRRGLKGKDEVPA